jgi:hypothetical protein
MNIIKLIDELYFACYDYPQGIFDLAVMRYTIYFCGNSTRTNRCQPILLPK